MIPINYGGFEWEHDVEMEEFLEWKRINDHVLLIVFLPGKNWRIALGPLHMIAGKVC